MSRQFDYDKQNYGNAYGYRDQHVRHILADNMLGSYGANPARYAPVAFDNNYRMGPPATNMRDVRIDNQWHNHTFGNSPYDAYALANNSSRAASGKIGYQQQLNAVGTRYDTARSLYQQTGEHKYKMMCDDLRDIAVHQLDADGRQFRKF